MIRDFFMALLMILYIFMKLISLPKKGDSLHLSTVGVPFRCTHETLFLAVPEHCLSHCNNNLALNGISVKSFLAHCSKVERCQRVRPMPIAARGP
jgi:hypothetical protein